MGLQDALILNSLLAGRVVSHLRLRGQSAGDRQHNHRCPLSIEPSQDVFVQRLAEVLGLPVRGSNEGMSKGRGA